MRIGWGVILTLVGLVLSIPLVPGPGSIILFWGIGVLAREVPWVKRFLAGAKDWTMRNLPVVYRFGVWAKNFLDRHRLLKKAAKIIFWILPILYFLLFYVYIAAGHEIVKRPSAHQRWARPASPSGPQDLRGSPESLAKQNKVADLCKLSRFKDDRELQSFIARKLLVRVQDWTETYYVTTEERFRYLRPWAKDFLEGLAKKHNATFGKHLKVTSLVRTEAYQRMLVKRGISDADGETEDRRSAHLTGSAFDVSRRDMSFLERAWMRWELWSLKRKEVIEAVEEGRHNNTFHIMVVPPCYRNRQK